MIYSILQQHPHDERTFELQNEQGDKFWVDIYTSGMLPFPDGADETPEKWRAWLGSHVGKQVEIEMIVPYMYFASQSMKVLSDE